MVWLADFIDPVYISLFILIVLIVVYMTEIISSTVATMLALVAFVVTGTATPASAFSGFSNNIVYMLVGVLLVGEAMMASGLATLIGRTCLKLARGKEKTFVLFGMIAIALLSMWLDNTTMLAVFLSIMIGAKIASRSGEGGWRILNLCMPICLAAMVGGGLSLVGCTTNLTGSSVLQGLTDNKMAFGMFDLTPIALMNIVLLIIWVMLIGFRKGKKIWGDRPDDAIDMSSLPKLAEVDKPKLIKMIIVLVILLTGFATGIVPQGIVGVFCGALCCVLKIIDFNKTIKQINWDVTIRLAGTLGLAKCLVDGGLVDWLGTSFTSAFGSDVNPWVIFILSSVAAMFISQFMGNSATIMVIATPMGAIALGLGINPVPIIMGITLAGSYAFCTFIAGACIGLSATAGYKFKDYIRYNWQPTLISLLCIMAIPLFYPFYV